MPFGVSVWELMILLLVLLLVFGAKRLPEMGKSLGKGMREFKDAVSGTEEATTSSPAQLPAAPSEQSTPSHAEEPAAEGEREAVR